MPAFSRLQLAQALLEYDNEDLPPEAPRRSAHDSAIFAHLRRARGPPRPTTTVYGGEGPRQSANHLGVQLPHDGEAAGTELGSGFRGSVGARRSLDIQNALPTRKSVDVLRSDWGDKRASRVEASELGYLGTPDEDEDAPEGGMDLSSWGLDKFVAKPDQEQHRSKSRQGTSDRRVSVMSRSPSDALPNPFARMPTPADNDSVLPERPKHSHRHSDFGAGGAFLDAQRSQDNLAHDALKDRRRSVANPLDLEEYRANGPHIPLEKRRQSVGLLPSESVPFSLASSPAPLAENNDEDLPNPFALPPPTPDRLSRFDPKAQRSLSQVQLHDGDGDAFSMRTGTMREGTAHLRTYSNASLGSRALLDDFKDDGASYMTGMPLDAPGNKPVSRMEILRPKVLVMPSPLQGSLPQPNQNAGRAGFMLSSDGTPLPPGATPGARPGARALAGAGVSRSSQSVAEFTPNPRSTMSLSQLTFRNNLMVDGSRDVAYNDIDQQLRRATADGEQVEQAWDDYDAETEAPQAERPAGRLYGRSLMDDLQDRKAQIHGRQRVFRGDNRPAMMARGQIRTQSTLIDAATLQPRPVTVFPHGPITATTEQRPNVNRASTIQPLLNFGSEEAGRVVDSKSVFGVDTLWEKEMAKLREMQEQQKLDEETQRAQADEKQKRKLKKGKKGKGKNEVPASPSAPANATESLNVPELNRLSSAPPTLPNITPLKEQAPPASPGESESSLPPVHHRRRSVATLDAGGWFAGSSDGEEESGVKRDSGPRAVPVSGGRDEDSDDDVPLTNIKVRAPESDDDEDAPLSNIKPRHSVLLPDLKPASTLDFAASLGLAPEPAQTKAAKGDDSDDEVPLAIRRQTIMLPQSSDNKPAAENDDSDDDEKPLGLRLSQAPSVAQQQRQAEYQQMMLMQQQQQQLMMQQQAMRASMFNPSMLSFQPHMGGPGSIHSFGAPVPIKDPKLTRVDRWRHDVSGGNDT
ncbi:hypothetical protein V565_005930 [Rhizoctonia solani 123E]|uniref:Uncharacterized protein n=1 Tax=Rhizoctonia solani 123E TaxID=1423351 RepID=A0A074SEX0_9AGAM|nr:hypothetical protein V565_005930 [Rhizoctonia solani 123E]